MKSVPALGLVSTLALAPLLAAEELSARYAHMVFPGVGSSGMPGWQVSVASDGPVLRFVLDVGGHYQGFGFHTVQIGPRLVSREAGGVSAFGQLLVGMGPVEGAVLVFSPGIGVDVLASEVIAGRLQAEWLLIASYGATRTFRLSAGLVVRIGRP